jgi:signal transduction histidine kinase
MRAGPDGATVVRMRMGERANVWLDRALAAAIAAVALVELWTADDRPDGLWLAVSVLLVAGSTVPLAWRRRAPLPVMAVISACAALSDALPEAFTGGAAFLAFILALYSAAAHSDRRGALVGAGIAAAVVAQVQIRQLLVDEPVDAPGLWLLLAAMWIAGRVVRWQKVDAVRLETRAARLEREQEEQARAAVAEERARIARELHDVLAHSVSVMVVQAQAAQRVLEGEQASARESLGAIEATGRDALDELRRLLGLLRRDDGDIALAPQPSLRHLDELVDHVREAGLPVEIQTEGEPRALAPGIDLSAYRIVQEALTNALRYAGPARARVLVRYGAQDVELEISDDGRGPQGGGGHGLAGMRERVALYGGTLEAGGGRDRGYSVRVRLPA